MRGVAPRRWLSSMYDGRGMFRFYQHHFEWRGRALMAARYDALCEFYAYPLEVDLGGTRLTIEDRSTLIVHLHRHRTALEAAGIKALVPRVVAVDLPGAGSRVWVRWRQDMGGSYGPNWSDAVYHMQLQDDAALITRIAFTRLMLPEFGRAATHRRLVRSGAENA